MLITILMLVFLSIIPGSFRKKGVALILENDNMGVFHIIFSKFLYWMAVLQIAFVWSGDYINTVMIIIGACFSFGVFRDRKYVFLHVEKKLIKNH